MFNSPKPKKAAAPKAPVVTKSAGTKPIVKGSGTFSLFGGAAPKPAPKKAPVVEKKPTPAKKTNSFGMFAPKPKKAAAPKESPAPVKAAKKSPTFSLFGGSSPKKAAPAPEQEAPKPVAKKSSGFSFFGGAPAPKKAPVAKAATPAKKAPVAKKAAPKKAAPKKTAPAGVPIVGKFKQNSDGSISGIVRNAKNFRNGTKITTSPVRKGAKAGDLVTTSSGSKYFLE